MNDTQYIIGEVVEGEEDEGAVSWTPRGFTHLWAEAESMCTTTSHFILTFTKDKQIDDGFLDMYFPHEHEHGDTDQLDLLEG